MADKKQSVYNIDAFKDIIRADEGLSLIPYQIPGEKHYTIGYGHYGPDVLEPKQTKITKKRAEDLLDKDVKVRVKEIDSLIPNFKKFPTDVQNAIFSEYYRGSIRQSPNTVDLINAGEYSKAAEEFLKNKQYENAEALGIPGIRPRMEAVKDALLSMGIESREPGGPVNAGQPYLVGEDGPEIIVPEQSGTVIPNNQLASPFNLQFDATAFADAYAQLFPTEPVSEPLPEKPKMKYITFEDPNAPRFAVPENLTKEQLQQYMKSPEIEQEMFNKGYLYKYGLDPVRYDDPQNLDDWNFTAGLKSGYDSLKSIGSGFLYTMADLFNNEEYENKFAEMVGQYNLDAGVHQFKEGEEGKPDLRITTIEDMMQDENKLGSFLDCCLLYTSPSPRD